MLPVNLGSAALWAFAACSLVPRNSMPGKELPWDFLAGTKALMARSGNPQLLAAQHPSRPERWKQMQVALVFVEDMVACYT